MSKVLPGISILLCVTQKKIGHFPHVNNANSHSQRTRHERESLFAFWDGNGKTKNGREREIQINIPVVRDGNRKNQIEFWLNWIGTGNFKEL